MTQGVVVAVEAVVVASGCVDVDGPSLSILPTDRLVGALILDRQRGTPPPEHSRWTEVTAVSNDAVS